MLIQSCGRSGGKEVRRSHQRLTFRDIVENSRLEAAKHAWERARTASQLRHLAAKRDARILSGVKTEALTRAAAILPEEIKVTIDNDFQIGMVSVQWKDHGRFHLPAAVQDLSEEQTVA